MWKFNSNNSPALNKVFEDTEIRPDINEYIDGLDEMYWFFEWYKDAVIWVIWSEKINIVKDNRVKLAILDWHFKVEELTKKEKKKRDRVFKSYNYIPSNNPYFWQDEASA